MGLTEIGIGNGGVTEGKDNETGRRRVNETVDTKAETHAA